MVTGRGREEREGRRKGGRKTQRERERLFRGTALVTQFLPLRPTF